MHQITQIKWDSFVGQCLCPDKRPDAILVLTSLRKCYCFTATYVSMVNYIGQVISDGNEAR